MSNGNNETNELGEKLDAANKKAEDQKAAARAKVVKGAHLLNALLDEKTLDGLTVEENKSFKKITGIAKGKAVYVAKKGGRVDLSGFTLDSPAVTKLTEEEARDKNIGRVRGQFNFGASDDEVLAAYAEALAELRIPTPEPEPKVKAPKAAAPAPTETTETTPEASA